MKQDRPTIRETILVSTIRETLRGYGAGGGPVPPPLNVVTNGGVTVTNGGIAVTNTP